MPTAEKRGIQYPEQDFTLPEGFTTAIRVAKPAHEQRDPNPSRDYGVGCVHLNFTLTGPKGAIDFEVFTGWYLPDVAYRFRREPLSHERARSPVEGHPGCTWFHARGPQWEGQEAAHDCNLLGEEGEACYCDVGYTIGDDLWDGLVTAGEPGLWKRMKELHDSLSLPDDNERTS